MLKDTYVSLADVISKNDNIGAKIENKMFESAKENLETNYKHKSK